MFNIFYILAKRFWYVLIWLGFFLIMIRTLICAAALLTVFCSSASADFKNYWEGLKNDVKSTWNEGSLSLFAPFYAWHNRLTYDKKHIDKYNENAWGFGVGRSYYDGDDWHGLYAMGFKDSNRYLETIFGYAYLKNYALDEAHHWKAGVGYTLSLTQRHEYSYIPVPLPLPIAGIAYKNISLNAAYVPGVKNDGNVLFMWLKFDF